MSQEFILYLFRNFEFHVIVIQFLFISDVLPRKLIGLTFYQQKAHFAAICYT